MKNICIATVEIFSSLFAEINATVCYAFNGTQFRLDDRSIQFYVIPTFDSDNVFIPTIWFQLSISVDVNDTNCFSIISLQYLCDNNRSNRNSSNIEGNCVNNTKYLESTWYISCYVGNIRYKFLSGKTIDHAFTFKTISKYF